MGPDELAPRPDPFSGMPRPPRAPAFTRREKDSTQDRARETDPAKAPTPPPGQGPVLVWFKPTLREELIKAGLGAVLIVIGGTLIQGFSIQWMSVWWLWLIVLVGTVGVLGAGLRIQPSAGAEWAQQWGGGWVRTYELTKATAYSTPTGIHLNLTDRDDRHINISVAHLQKDRFMWDLVYNGIVHSVIAGGAETNGALHSALQVPRPKVAVTTGEPGPPRESSQTYVAIMYGAMVLGFAWLIIDYLAGDRIDILGGWEILIGFGLLIVGLVMVRQRR